MLSIYKYKDYKKYLKEYISTSMPHRGLMKNLANAANCHPSYLTQALQSKVQLTPDHAIGIADYIGLSSADRDYFLLLVDYGRCSRLELRQFYEKKMAELRAKQEKITERLQKETIQDTEFLARYYSTWQISAIHIMTSIPEFQKAERIAEALQIKIEQSLNFLKELERMGLVKHEGALWKYSGKTMHVPEDSYLVHLHHNNWRQRAVLNSQLASPRNIHFTGVYSISKEDYDPLKEVILQTIESFNNKATASGVETPVAFCCDLFEV